MDVYKSLHIATNNSVSVSVSPGVSCPEDYEIFNGTCFGFHDTELNQSDAEAACNDFLPGGHLAAFHSQQEYNFVRNLKINEYVLL